jgi:hypothetical protein
MFYNFSDIEMNYCDISETQALESLQSPGKDPVNVFTYILQYTYF